MQFFLCAILSFSFSAIVMGGTCQSEILSKTQKTCYYGFEAPPSSFSENWMKSGCQVSYQYPYSSYRLVTLTILDSGCEVITRTYQEEVYTGGTNFSEFTPWDPQLYEKYRNCKEPTEKVRARVAAHYAVMYYNQCK